MSMKFYDENNNEIIIPGHILDEEINHGECATIYRYNEKLCFKYYDRGKTFPRTTLNAYIYEDLKKFKHSNLVNIKKLLYKEKNYKYIVNAYLLSYYREKYEDFLEVPTEYLLYNIEEIFKLLKKISEFNIRVHDLKRENIILADKNIVLIDPDMWDYDYSNYKKEIEKLNINNIIAMFNDITEESLKKYHLDFLIKNDLYYYIISNKLFPLKNNPNKAVKVLSKRLNDYKRPIDYVYSLKK